MRGVFLDPKQPLVRVRSSLRAAAAGTGKSGHAAIYLVVGSERRGSADRVTARAMVDVDLPSLTCLCRHYWGKSGENCVAERGRDGKK